MGRVCVPQHGVKAMLTPSEYNPSHASSGCWREKSLEQSRESIGSSFTQNMLWLLKLPGSPINPRA